MSKYPANWKIVPLEKVAEIIGGGTPSRDNSEFWGNDHYWITPSEVVVLDGGFVHRSNEKISNLGLQNSSAKLLPAGTILMTSRASIGYAAISKTSITTNQGFQSIICNENLDNLFALYQIINRKSELECLAAGSTFLEISSKNVRSFPFILPPIQEQKKIAIILATADRLLNLLHKKKQLIQFEKISIINKHIQSFYNQNSPLLSCKDICKKIFVGIASSATHAYTKSGGIPMLRNQNIKEGYIDNTDVLKISKEFANQHVSKELKTGDVLSARTGYPGTSSVISSEFNGCHSFTTLISRVNQDCVIPNYYAIFLNSFEGKAKIRKIQAGGAQENLNVSSLEKLQMPVPELNQQLKLVNSVISFNSLIDSIEMKIRNLTNLKTALANELFSGRKRIEV